LVLLAYAVESFLQAYELRYLAFGASNQLAALRDLFPGPSYVAILPWQSIILEQAVPFLLFFWVARKMRLSPFRSALPMALALLFWGMLLAILQFPFAAYADQVVLSQPSGVSFSMIASELMSLALPGRVGSATDFLLLGFTAVAFAYFWSDRPLWNFRGWLEEEDPATSGEGMIPDQPKTDPSSGSLAGPQS